MYETKKYEFVVKINFCPVYKTGSRVQKREFNFRGEGVSVDSAPPPMFIPTKKVDRIRPSFLLCKLLVEIKHQQPWGRGKQLLRMKNNLDSDRVTLTNSAH